MLEEAQEGRLLGPAPVADVLRHAEAFAGAIGQPPGRALDLGSGAGVPGLSLACRWPGSRWSLLDASRRAVRFLQAAIDRLGLDSAVEAVHARAEDAGRWPDWRGAFDLVVCRSLGPPAVVAECAAPFLRVGGRLLVSEPPAPDPNRWPPDLLREVGLAWVRLHDREFHFAELRQAEPCPARYPRRPGIPDKRPLAP